MALLLREAIGDTIRRARTERRRTLRDVSRSARVSLGYLSEIERGRKEPSSELLAAICEALAMSLPDLLDDAADTLRPSGPRRRRGAVLGAVDPALRSAVEEAFEPVTDGEEPAPAAGASGSGPSGGEARASAADPTLPPDALAGADDDPDGTLDGLAVTDLADPTPVPGTVTLVARLPVPGADAPLRVAA